MQKLETDSFERYFSIFTLFLLTRVPAFDSLFIASEGELSSGGHADSLPLSTLLSLLLLVCYLITLFFVVCRFNQSILSLSRGKFLFLLLALILLSFIWSELPSHTLKRSIMAIGTALFGVYISSRYTLKEQVSNLGWALGIAVTVNILFSLAVPSAGLESGVHAGSWRGALVHKNVLGRQGVLSALVFMILAFSARSKRLLPWVFFALSIVVVIMTNSKSSLFNLFVLVVLFILCKLIRQRLDISIPFFAFLLALIFSFGSFLSITQGSSLVQEGGVTLTGRTIIWELTIENILNRPILGYGFEAFWNSKEVVDVWRGLNGFQADNAHNGFIQLGLDVGLLGLTFFLLDCLQTLFLSIKLVHVTKMYEYCFPLICLVFLLLSSQTEIGLVQQHSMLWFLYISLSLSTRAPKFKPSLEH